jgi:hypothetical protein
MAKDFNNVDKIEYQSPVLIEYGTVDSITQSGVGAIIDSFGPGASNVSG